MSQTKKNWGILLLGAIPLLFEAAVIYYPFFSSALKYVSYGSFVAVVESQLVRHAVEQSFAQAVLGALASMLLGYPAGLILGLVDFPASSIYRALAFLPFLLPSIVVIVGFEEAYGSAYPFNLLTHGLSGIVAINAYYNSPLVALLVASSLERLNPELIYAARTLGAQRFEVFSKIVAPLTKNALLVGVLLAFTYSYLSFLIPLAIGGPTHYTLEVAIYFYLRFGGFGEAMALAVLQLLSLIAVAVLLIRLGGFGFTFGRFSAKTRAYSRLESPVGVLAYLFLALFLAYELYPLGGLAYHAVFFGGLFAGFRELLQASAAGALEATLLQIVANSTVFAVLSAAATLALSITATHFALSAKRTQNYQLLMLIPLLISPVSIGVSLYLSYYNLAALNDVWLLIVFAQSAVAVPVAMRFLLEGLRRTPKEIVFSSRVLGAGELETLFRVELPASSHAISSAVALALAVSLGEFAATNIVYVPKFATIPIAIFSLLEIRRLGAAAALSVVLVVLALIAYYPVFRLGSHK